jgi:hypothetical protein
MLLTCLNDMSFLYMDDKKFLINWFVNKFCP